LQYAAASPKQKTRTRIRGGRELVSLKLDDPSFAAPIYANLIERNGQHELIWSR
jgi:uncharacterized protein (DUF736 family)